MLQITGEKFKGTISATKSGNMLKMLNKNHSKIFGIKLFMK